MFLRRAPIVSGHVLDMSVDSRGRGTKWLVTYGFSDSGRAFTNTEAVREWNYHKLHDGATVPVSTMVIGSRRFAEIHLSMRDYFLQPPLWLLGVVFSGFILWLLGKSEARVRRCVRNGEPTIGIIESKRTYSTRNGTTYYVKYQFTDSQNCLRAGKRMYVKRADYEHLQEGQRVVVIYDSNWSLIYQCEAYEAI